MIWPRLGSAVPLTPRPILCKCHMLNYHVTHSKNVYISLNVSLPCKGMVAAAIAMKRMSTFSTFRYRYFRWVMKLNFPSVVSICWQCMAELCVCVSVVRKKPRGLLSFRCIFMGKFIKFFEKSSIYVFDSW